MAYAQKSVIHNTGPENIVQNSVCIVSQATLGAKQEEDTHDRDSIKSSY